MEFLEHLAVGKDVHGIPAAGLFAEAAAGAVFLNDQGLAEEVASVLGEFQDQRVKGTDVDAEFAAAANALVWVYNRLGPFLFGELAQDVTNFVQDAFHRTDGAAGAAVYAEGRGQCSE